MRQEAAEDSSAASSDEELPRDAAPRRTEKLLREERSRSRLKNYLEESTAARLSGRSLLEELAVRRPARLQYQHYLDRWVRFCDAKEMSMRTDAEVDSALVVYFNHCFLTGRQAYEGEKTMAALMDKVPEFSKLGTRKAPRAWRCLQGWRRLTPGRTRRPLPLAVWAAIATGLCQRGHPQMAVWVLLGLSAYLRPSENMRLRRKDLVPPASGVTRSWALLVAPEEVGVPTKVNTVDDSVLLDSPWLMWLTPALRALREGDLNLPLWDFEYPSLTRELKVVSEYLGLPPVVPYQLRHSGPSLDRIRGDRTQEECRKRGRWQSHGSLVRYEKHARLAQEWNAYAEQQREHFLMCEERLEAVVLGMRPAPTPAAALGTAQKCTRAPR